MSEEESDSLERLLEDLDRASETAGEETLDSDGIWASYFGGREPESITDTYAGDIVQDVSRRLHALMPHDAGGREIKVGDKLESLEDYRFSHTAASIKALVTIESGGALCGSDGWEVVQPDSWERLEEEALLTPREYMGKIGRPDEFGTGAIACMTADIVRRAKKLAGVE